MKARQGLSTAPSEAHVNYNPASIQRKHFAQWAVYGTAPFAPFTWATLLKTVPPKTVAATAKRVKLLVFQEGCAKMRSSLTSDRLDARIV